MKSDVQHLSETRVKMVVEVPFDELADDLSAAYRSIASQVQVPGFRKGKVPARVIDQRFGRGTVLSEVVNAVVPRTYDSLVAEHELVPLGQPDVEVTKLEDGDYLEFTAEVDVRPDFDLPDHEGIQVEVPSLSVDEDAVNEELDSLRNRFASFAPVERAAQDGDVLLLDVAAASEGEQIEELSQTAISYELGSGGGIEGLDEAVAGAEANEERTFEHIPADGDFEGKTVEMTVTVKAVRERALPELDDEFAMLASEFDTLEDLTADVRDRLRRMRLVEQGQQARSKVHDAYLDLVEVAIPEGLIAQQIEEHFADDHGDDDHRAETENELRKNLKSQLVLDKFAEVNEVEVSEMELTQWLMSQAPQYGMTPEQFAQALVEQNQVQLAMADVRRGKALSVILEAAEIVDEDGEPVDLDELARLLTGAGSDVEDEEESEVLPSELDDAADVVVEAEEIVDEAADEEVESAEESTDAENEADKA